MVYTPCLMRDKKVCSQMPCKGGRKRRGSGLDAELKRMKQCVMKEHEEAKSPERSDTSTMQRIQPRMPTPAARVLRHCPPTAPHVPPVSCAAPPRASPPTTSTVHPSTPLDLVRDSCTRDTASATSSAPARGSESSSSALTIAANGTDVKACAHKADKTLHSTGALEQVCPVLQGKVLGHTQSSLPALRQQTALCHSSIQVLVAPTSSGLSDSSPCCLSACTATPH